jgi:hypothetical protein
VFSDDGVFFSLGFGSSSSGKEVFGSELCVYDEGVAAFFAKVLMSTSLDNELDNGPWEIVYLNLQRPVLYFLLRKGLAKRRVMTSPHEGAAHGDTVALKIESGIMLRVG